MHTRHGCRLPYNGMLLLRLSRPSSHPRWQSILTACKKYGKGLASPTNGKRYLNKVQRIAPSDRNSQLQSAMFVSCESCPGGLWVSGSSAETDMFALRLQMDISAWKGTDISIYPSMLSHKQSCILTWLENPIKRHLDPHPILKIPSLWIHGILLHTLRTSPS